MPQIDLPELECTQCGHTWTPRKEDVRICPKCKSIRWDEDQD